MLVTVLLSTLNNADRLALTLEGFTRLRIPEGCEWEVVVADNGSTDNTAEVLHRWEGRLPLRSVWEPLPGVSRARNAGLAAAGGEFIIFTDDDVTVPTEWVAEYVRAYQHKGPGYYFGGPIDSELEGPPPSDEWLRIAPASVKGLQWGDEARELKRGEYFTGANWACRADAARKAGGFDVRMGPGGSGGPRGGEENDLMERLEQQGLRSWYIPGTRVAHWVPAAKLLPQHLLARQETHAAVKAWKGRTWYGRIRVYRIPWRLYPERALSVLHWLAARVGLADPVEAGLRRARARGAWIGFRLPPR